MHVLSLLFLLPLACARPPPEDIPPKPPTSFKLIPSAIIKKTSSPLGTNGPGRTGSTSASSFAELQLNLCNSGLAKCYAKGQSIQEGAELIYATGPNVVTLNEICSNDIAPLQRSLAEVWPTDYTYSVFMSAEDKEKKARYKCTNGNFYGSAVLGRVPKSAWKGIDAYGGQYTTQDGTKEGRIFACVNAKGDHFACTSHLSAGPESTALAQCRALMFDAVPYLKAKTGASGRTVVGGDFNLKYNTRDAENVQKCVPNGYTRKGDGDKQHVIFANDLKFVSTKKYGLTFTDHDGFLVKLKK